MILNRVAVLTCFSCQLCYRDILITLLLSIFCVVPFFLSSLLSSPDSPLLPEIFSQFQICFSLYPDLSLGGRVVLGLVVASGRSRLQLCSLFIPVTYRQVFSEPHQTLSNALCTQTLYCWGSHEARTGVRVLCMPPSPQNLFPVS